MKKQSADRPEDKIDPMYFVFYRQTHNAFKAIDLLTEYYRKQGIKPGLVNCNDERQADLEREWLAWKEEEYKTLKPAKTRRC